MRGKTARILQAERRLGGISERDFQQQIIDLATLRGWLVYHTHDSRRSQPGFPDLVMARGARLIFAEIKSERGMPSDEQSRWLAALFEAQAEAYVWRPSSWPEIAAALGGVRPS